MYPPEKNEIKADMRNKLQLTKTLLEGLADGKVPSEEHLKLSMDNIKELTELIEKL